MLHCPKFHSNIRVCLAKTFRMKRETLQNRMLPCLCIRQRTSRPASHQSGASSKQPARVMRLWAWCTICCTANSAVSLLESPQTIWMPLIQSRSTGAIHPWIHDNQTKQQYKSEGFYQGIHWVWAALRIRRTQSTQSQKKVQVRSTVSVTNIRTGTYRLIEFNECYYHPTPCVA